MSLNDKLVKLLSSIHKVNLQNLLMPVPDREIALSMIYMRDVDRNNLLTLLSGNKLSGKKSKRIVDELKLISRVNIKYDLYCISIKRIINLLNNIKNDGSIKSYLRPKRGRFKPDH